MTHSEQEEILRRALHAVADQIEPAADGLERIRERLTRPRPLAVAWLMAAWTGLAQPVLLRVEPVLAELAGRPSGRLGTWLRPAIAWLLAAIRMLRPRSGMSRHEKLRSALAFAAAALIGTVGGLALSAGLPEHMIQEASSFFSPSQGPSTHGHNLVANGSGQHTFPSASGPGTYTRHKSSPITTPHALRRLRPARHPRHRRHPPHRRPDQHSHRHADPEPGRRQSFALHQPTPQQPTSALTRAGRLVRLQAQADLGSTILRR
jgi:hypothetical protein